MLDVLEADPTLLENRWGVMDFDRFYPGRTWHVQTTASDLPAAYGGPAILSFLQENHLTFLEAEQGCGNEATCAVGMILEADADSSEQTRSLSSSGGIVAGPGAGEGILWERRILVVGIGVQRVAIVLERQEGLECGPYIVELNLTRMKRPTRGLDVVLELLAALTRSIALPHRHRPDPASDSANSSAIV